MKTILFIVLISSFAFADDGSVTNIYNYYYGTFTDTSDPSNELRELLLTNIRDEYKNIYNNGGCTYKTISVKLKNGGTAPFYYCN